MEDERESRLQKHREIMAKLMPQEMEDEGETTIRYSWLRLYTNIDSDVVKIISITCPGKF